jgi:hypothetical protein
MLFKTFHLALISPAVKFWRVTKVFKQLDMLFLMVKTYQDPAKDKSRAKLKEFIEKHLDKDPKETRVVCFPGAEKKGEEALEVREVYDALGIPRQNITGLEYDAEKAERLRKADLGINVINSPDIDFFSTTKDVFDIISLDYTGHQGKDETKTLEMIAGRQCLASNGVLCTNYAARRESKAFQLREMHRYIAGKLQGRLAKRGMSDRKCADIMKKTLESGKVELPLEDVRDATTSEILRAFDHGIMCKERDLMVFKLNPIYQLINEHLLKTYRSMLESDEKELAEKLVEKGIVAKDWIEKLRTDPKASPKLYFIMHKAGLESYVSQMFPVKASGCFAKFLINSELKAYDAEGIERYCYVSNKNMTMHMDIFMFDQHRQEYERFSKVLKPDYLNFELAFNPGGYAEKELKQEIIALFDFMSSRKHVVIPERVFLGSSWKPGQRESISKEEVVFLLQAGVPAEEILETYKGWTTGQLAALKAHYITMGKKLG